MDNRLRPNGLNDASVRTTLPKFSGPLDEAEEAEIQGLLGEAGRGTRHSEIGACLKQKGQM